MGRYDDVPLGHQLMYAKEHFDVLGQPKWKIPDTVVIEAAISGDHYQDPARRLGKSEARVTARDEALKAIAAGASAVHFSAYNAEGERSGELDDYRFLVEPCRQHFGTSFLANCNAIRGATFEEKHSAIIAGLAEESVINCVYRYHPRYLQAAAEIMETNNCRPHLTVRDTMEITDTYNYLIKPGFVRKPYSWLIYPNFDGMPLPDARALHTGLQFMVDRIRDIDEASVVMVGCNGRAGIFLCATAMIMGLNVRVELEDSHWLTPLGDEPCPDNGVAVARAVELAGLFGRRPASGDDYRRQLGLKPRGERG